MKSLFYQPLGIKAPNHQVAFWSDCHFGHRCEHWEHPLWSMRGFESVEDHDETLIRRWNSVCTPNTTMFHLGDFIFGKDTIERFENMLSNRLNFNTLYIMPGNHASGWKQCFERQEGNVWQIGENKKVVFAPNIMEINVNGQHITLSHYAIASFPKQGKGAWMLHGHSHGRIYNSAVGPILYKANIADIGVEVQPAPITFGGLQSMFRNRQAVSFDHHVKDGVTKL